MKPIDLNAFEAVFRASADPWATRTSRDEATKREAIYRALGTGRRGRVLEIASGNGSNSAGLARRALRLLATDGAQAAVELTRDVLDGCDNATAEHAILPGGLPRGRFEAVVVAEVLYYLREAEIVRLGRELAMRLAPAGCLVLAHHHVDFHDTASHPAFCHDRLLAGVIEGGRNVVARRALKRTRQWRVERVDLVRVPT